MLLVVIGLIYFGIRFTAPVTHLISDSEKFGKYLQSFGAWGDVIFILAQVLQVVVAPIPGELMQVAGGFIYGTVWGTVYSVGGILLGSIVVFGFSRWFGYPLLKLVVPENALRKFSFIINHPKTELVILVLFLVPGSPKDVLTYMAGLTPVKPLRFLLAAMVARFPGILLASYIGAHVETREYHAVIIASLLALGLFVSGVLLQDRITRFLQRFKQRHG